MHRTISLAFAILIAATTLAGCTGVPGPEETEVFDRTVAGEPESSVVVVNRNGGVNMGAWDGITSPLRRSNEPSTAGANLRRSV